MIRSLAFLALLVVAASAVPHAAPRRFSVGEAERHFNHWAAKHGKSYTDATAPAALKAFHANLEFVTEHNLRAENGQHQYAVALNKFADLTWEEFRSKFLGFAYDANRIPRNPIYNNGTAPDSIDWRAKGAVTPVKNQGQCGSCWAFSATGALEGANFIKTGKLVALSEQELLDCDTVDNACNGGLMDNAFDFVKQNGGIDSEDDWKYLARKTLIDTCPKKKETKHVGTCSSHVDVPANDESQLQLAAALQPVSVAIEADQQGFQFYSSGIFADECGTNLDHGVLLVGYGTEDKQDYWIVKNSWGEEWGEEGYIRFARNIADKSGQCGIAMAASAPVA